MALRMAGLMLIAGAGWALSTGSITPRDAVDDIAVAAFGLAVFVVSPKPTQSWALFIFGAIASGGVLMVGDVAWPYRMAAVMCLVVFSLVLWESYQTHLGSRRVACPEVQRIALRSKTQYGVSLDELSRLSPVMLVFLRHTGCPFCRQALAELSDKRAGIESLGVRIVLVLMVEEAEAHRFLTEYGLEDVNRVIDLKQSVYRAFGLQRGGLMSIIGPRLWPAGLLNTLRHGGWLPSDEDVFQMPGVFLIFHGEVLSSYRHQSIADRPDFLGIARSDNLSEFSRP